MNKTEQCFMQAKHNTMAECSTGSNDGENKTENKTLAQFHSDRIQTHKVYRRTDQAHPDKILSGTFHTAQSDD